MRAEVLAGFDDADPEELLPDAVDGHASGERVVPRNEPMSEPESVRWC